MKNFVKNHQKSSFIDVMKEKVIEMNYEPANSNLYEFRGSMNIDKTHVIPLSNENFLLRGCYLKNTDWVIGIVCYNGHHSKIMKNSVEAKEKQSLLEEKLAGYIVLNFIFLLIFCLSSSLLYIIWAHMDKDNILYLEIADDNLFKEFFIRFGNWILIFSNFIPISLMVTVEMVKFLQAYMLDKSKSMIDFRGINAKVHSSNLNEELGQIQYVFSDKTGTLTCNKMVFKHIIVGSITYPNQKNTSMMDFPDFINNDVQNVDFNDRDFFCNIRVNKNIKEVLKLLSICHTIQVNQGVYTASSPDEIAFVNFAKMCGYEFVDIDSNNNVEIKIFGKIEKFQIKHVF